MKRMGIEALYRKPNTSKPAPGHKVYPYLLRGLTIDPPNQTSESDESRRRSEGSLPSGADQRATTLYSVGP